MAPNRRSIFGYLWVAFLPWLDDPDAMSALVTLSLSLYLCIRPVALQASIFLRVRVLDTWKPNERPGTRTKTSSLTWTGVCVWVALLQTQLYFFKSQWKTHVCLGMVIGVIGCHLFSSVTGKIWVGCVHHSNQNRCFFNLGLALVCLAAFWPSDRGLQWRQQGRAPMAFYFLLLVQWVFLQKDCTQSQDWINNWQAKNLFPGILSICQPVHGRPSRHVGKYPGRLLQKM